MPSGPRGQIVRPQEVGVYHCWSRCVRRAFLCGRDRLTGKDFEYRRSWVCQMQAALAGLFAIEIGFRAELSNHIHLLLRTRPEIVATWSDDEVIRRWLKITKLAKSRDGVVKEPHPARIAIERAIPFRIPLLRVRLSDPSWFMGILCEYVARRSNLEDGCRGCFWEDRYKCRDLVNEAAILICGIYVDLNQIRAGEAETPETSIHTSAFDRICARQRTCAEREVCAGSQRARSSVLSTAASPSVAPDDWLCELTLDERVPVNDARHFQSASGRRASDKGLLSLSLDQYLELLDATGRIMQPGKSGSIPCHLVGILDRLGIRSDMWSTIISGYERLFGKIVGPPAQVVRRAEQAGRHWYRGIKACNATFT